MVGRALRTAAAARTPPALVVTAAKLADSLRRRRSQASAGAVQVRSFSAVATIQQNLDTVTGAFDRAGVSYDAPPAAVMRRPVVTVGPGDVEPARAVLGGDLGPGVRVRPAEPGTLRVYTAQAAGDLLLAGPELGVDVVLTGLAPPLDHAGEPPVGFPVDAVYTWVDGTDPAWRQRKEAAWAAPIRASTAGSPRTTRGSPPGTSCATRCARWRCTPGGSGTCSSSQTSRCRTGWRPRTRGLTVVDHREIFPADGAGLPTFNSHAIEARLHHIPGLADHYLYLNDDVFFGRPVAPELFFRADGASRFFVAPSTLDDAPPSTGDRPVDAAAKVSSGLVAARVRPGLRMKFQHVAHPQRRDLLVDLEHRFAAELERTVRRPFRHPDDVSAAASLAHHVGSVTGRAVPGELRYLYCDIAERRAPIKLHRLARERDADMFCLNDVEGPTDGPGPSASHDPERLVRDFLTGYFPLPSRFEGGTGES